MAGNVLEGAFQQKGQELYAAGDYVGAAEQYRLWVEASPANNDAWRLLGFAQYACGHLKEAQESFGRALALDPDNSENHFGLGMANLAVGDLDHGVAALDETLKIRPDHIHAKGALVDALIKRAAVYESKGQAAYAEHDFDRACKLDKQSATPVLAYVKHLVDTGQLHRAQKILQQALIDHPNEPAIQDAALRHNVKIDAEAVSEAQRRQQVQQSQQIPCPICKKMVMNWAVVCPHCHSTIKDRSQFAGRGALPKTSWQEVAYKIMAVLWMLWGAWTVFAALMWRQSKYYFEGMEAPFVIFGVVEIGIGIGLLTESEVMQFITRIVCYLSFGIIGFGFLGGMMLNRWFLWTALLEVAFATFQLYLLKEVGGD